jgi:hypothetical protein
MSSVNNLHSRDISSTIFFVACCDAADLRIALKAFPLRLARCSWLAKLQVIRITLVLDDSRWRLGCDTFRP